jgi:galactonate dehydratase
VPWRRRVEPENDQLRYDQVADNESGCRQMRVTALKTLRLGEFPNLCLVIVETDEGLFGLGETYFGAAAVSAWIHETAAPYLLGREALDIQRHSLAVRPFVGSTGTGVETRGRSAIDIALWDLLGKRAGLPLYRLLGGKCRDEIRLYNTCAGPGYTRALPASPDLPTSNWGHQSSSQYDDLEAFVTDAGALAKDLLAEGITAMKIWPFDPFAEASGGNYISARDMRRGLDPFARVRNAVGQDMELIVELHAKWDLPNAIRIARSLEEFEPLWVEDPLRMDCIDALADFSSATSIPTGASETLAGSSAIRDAVERGGARVVLFDPSWVGGIGESLKVVAFAEDRHLPAAAHDCTGPVNFAVTVHLSASASNVFVQESVRAFYRGWYRELVTELPRVTDGYVAPLEGPGIGTCLREAIWERSDATVVESSHA